MSRLKGKIWQAAVFVSLALALTSLSEANARGAGGGGHSSVVRSFPGGSSNAGNRSGFYSSSGAPGAPSPKPRVSSYHGGRGYGGGGRGGYGNYNYNNNYANQQSYYQQPGPVNGQVFSGSAHITPSEYGRYVQSYQWPSSHP
jgi:hypothetical protein